MAYIITVLIVAILNGCLVFIDEMLEGILPLSLHAEQYLTMVSGTKMFDSLYNTVFGFGISLIILKFLKKGFETYVLWTDGDADEEPVSILTNFIKSITVAVCFPTLYSWMADVITDMTTKLVGAVGINTAPSWDTWVSHIAAAGIVSAIFALIFVAVYFILYFQFLMRGLEVMILRVGMPLACVGLIDNDKGVFKAYLNKFFQSMLAVMIQLCLCRLGVNLMLNLHTFWGVACMVLAVKTPKFLQDFLITTGGGGGAIVNNAYHSVRLVQMLKKGG